jgi:DNA-binding NtrC family response regulator
MANDTQTKRALLLSGWHYPEYMAATAAAYCALGGDADILGVSMAELAGALERFGTEYKDVYVLGVGLTENLERLANALKDLAKKGVKTRWISRQPIPEETAKAFEASGASFAELVVAKASSASKGQVAGLVQTVVDHFGNVAEKDARRLRRIGSTKEVKPSEYSKGDLSTDETWQILYLAAGYAHRDHRDESACGKVVKALAENRSIADGLTGEFKHLVDEFMAGYSYELIGKSPAAQEAKRRLLQAANCSKASVLILGETGTGKQVAAEYIHRNSDRRNGHFEHYNCAYGGNDDMLMDRLFGHEKGAFTGANSKRNGLFDDANGGTLFLDEIGETSERVQAMLLTVLETGKFIRVGGDDSRRVTVDVRLVCATNRDLQQMVLDGEFRLDLYQRICEFPVRLEPLRNRKEDIPLFVKHYWRNMTGCSPTKRQISALGNYDYPGNVRELQSILKQAKALCDSLRDDGGDYSKLDFAMILEEHERFNKKLIDGLRARRDGIAPADLYPDKQEELLCRHAVNVLRKYRFNLTHAAEAAGITVNTLRKYLKLAEAKGYSA